MTDYIPSVVCIVLGAVAGSLWLPLALLFGLLGSYLTLSTIKLHWYQKRAGRTKVEKEYLGY